MDTLKTVTVVLNVIFILIFFWFSKGLRWRNRKDRASIIGFTTMILLYIMDSILIFK